jgi:iron(III) transport system substrate-binding protein
MGSTALQKCESFLLKIFRQIPMSRPQALFRTLGAAALALCFLPAAPALAGEKLVVYSARIEALVKPMFDAYTKETGVEIQAVTDKEGALVERLKAEGANTPADLLITTDAGNLWQAAQEGVLRPIDSPALAAAVPANLRDPDQQWFGLTVRARTLFFNTQMVKAGELSTYEDLAQPAWRGKLCLRSSKKVYNQSLVAMLISEHGEAKAEEIVRGWVANLATEPFADDTRMLEAVAAGQCAVGIANTYYYGRLMEKKPDLPLGIFWANQSTGGVHINVTGAGLTRHGKQPAAAQKLLEWLASPQAQNLFADVNFESPVNPATAPSAAVQAWGSFKASPLNVVEAGRLQAKAVRLMDRAGYR